MGSRRAQRGRRLAWYEAHHPSVPHAEARHHPSALKIGELLVEAPGITLGLAANDLAAR